MKFKGFVPAFLLSLTLLLLLSLGFWQLDRADEKIAIELAISKAQKHSATEALNIKQLSDKEYYPVILKGRYDPNKQFIYDNQIVQGKAGYDVLTPFLLNNDGGAILVNRGFVAWNGNRNVLKNISINEKNTTILATLIKPIQRFQLKHITLPEKFPIILQSLQIEKLSALTGYQFSPMIARLDESAKNGFLRQWQPFYSSVDKHMAYALQWFLMAFVLFIICIHLIIKQRSDNGNKLGYR